MRIAYMLTSLGRGGAERQVVDLAERMAARGHQVLLIVLTQGEAHEWPTSVEVIRLDVRKYTTGLYSGLIAAHRLRRGFCPDLVHSHTFPANMAARILHVSGSAPAVLSTIHNVYEGGWPRTALYGLTNSLSIHTTAVSEAVATSHIEAGAVPNRKCSVLTNGIDAERFAQNFCRRIAMRAQLNAAGRFIWLAAGRLTAAKDYPNLLRAFVGLHSTYPSAELWIAGAGSPAVEKILQNFADARGISGSVRWLGLCDDMPALFDAADAFVLSSAWEGMPLVVGEAMAMEKLVVGTDVGGVCELVGDAGVIVTAKNPKALTDAMIRAMRMPEDQRRAMGHAARERILNHFDMDAKVDEWQALYERLVGERQ